MTTYRRVAAVGGLALLAVLVLGSCAAGANVAVGAGGYGFWYGLWHGIILPITFIVSLFTDSVSIYEVDNNGNWYDFGFVIGVAFFAAPAMAARGGRRT